MSGLLLINYVTAESARSPEMRYLASFVENEARKVFGPVETVSWRPGADAPAAPLPEGRPVLICGREDVHLGAASLERMRRALDDGAGIVVPRRLASFDLGTESPYTLRAFERLEARLLETRADEPGAPASRLQCHLPASLISPDLFARRLQTLPLERLLTDAALVGDLDLADDVTVAGIYHDYIDYYGEPREDVLPFIPAGASDVLEIGCGRGVTGALIKERLGCRVTGVELNPEVAKDAERRLDRVIVGDVEQLEIDGRFDAVVATELFEHLTYPDAFLNRVRRLVRPGGRIVLSVPNVGHHSVVEDLLAGRWDYLPIGLLCYTHFRFFTRATLASWLERLGFSEFEIVAQTTDLPERFAEVGDRFEVDLESLRTQGFYVVVTV